MQQNHPSAWTKFPPGRMVATRGAVAELTPDELNSALRRHLSGDWGDLDTEDKALNEEALVTKGRLLSAYHSASGAKFYIITERDRSATTVLLAHEY